MTPEILSLSGFAKLQGVRPSYITKLKGDGRLVLTDDGKVRVAESIELIEQTAGGRIDVSARHAAARDAGSDKTPPEVHGNGSGEKQRQNAKANDGSERAVDAKPHKEETKNRSATKVQKTISGLTKSRLIQEEFKAKRMKLEFEILEGSYVSMETYLTGMRFIGAAVRAVLEVFPDQNAPLVAPIDNLAEIHEILTQSSRDALNNIIDAIKRQESDVMGKSD